MFEFDFFFFFFLFSKRLRCFLLLNEVFLVLIYAWVDWAESFLTWEMKDLMYGKHV